MAVPADYLVNIPEGFVKLLKSAETMLNKLGLPFEFVFKLTDEDDWGFILKCHSLIDAAIEHVILQKCFNNKYAVNRDEHKLEKLVSGFNFDGRTGKLAYLSAFSLLDSKTIDFLRALSTIRNIYAHSIRNVGRTLEEICNERPDERLLKRLIRVDVSPDLMPNSDGQRRFYIAMAIVSVLWELEFRSEPRPSLLSALQSMPEAQQDKTEEPPARDGRTPEEP